LITSPFYVELRRDQSLLWCRCGRSRRQPYCDGSHAGTGTMPIRYRALQDEEVLLCGCKQTGTPPFCDGTHNSLVESYATDDPDREGNRLIREVAVDPDGKARIDGGCFVCKVDRRPFNHRPGMAWADLVSSQDGALYQALFCFDVQAGCSPVIAFGERQVALMFSDANALLEVGRMKFEVQADVGTQVGASIRPGEAFRITNRRLEPARVFASLGPAVDAPMWPESLSPEFDDRYPQRLAPVDPAQRQAMAERFFQVLVSKAHGAADLTQFIGEIPFSKALPHRHLYEETLIVLAGQGMMWTETMKAPVDAGDVIFLPRKQLHSLQCTSSRPMLLAGVIHPGDNPSINYY
jgi:CDGSH-type Zn-finger protein/mannose-6-phosphate isomerase-like protein (cupin superfamily)